MDPRRDGLKEWIESKRTAKTLELDSGWQLSTVSGDASFRRYFRAADDHRNYIAVDAPPDKENSEPFVRIAKALKTYGIHVPSVHHADLAKGYMLLEDLGDQQLLPLLNASSVDSWYAKALNSLQAIQKAQIEGLPNYDAPMLMREMRLLDEWFAPAILGRPLAQSDLEVLEPLYQMLIDSALQQPKVCVHRDYHSRNLMCLPTGDLGIIDFQDAVVGPITYDLVSILKDCYITWPRAQVESWVSQFHQSLLKDGAIPESVTGDQFLKWFDWMGLQRHIKVLGIFCRLALRDNKSIYLGDLPIVYAYVVDVANRYPELASFKAWLDTAVSPVFEQGLQKTRAACEAAR
jgi:aminoglycoside/choline kinase family phosphotransferase